MSDCSISIVPKQSCYPDRKQKAKEILEWLISKDIVKPTPSDCVYGGNGYEISNGARQVAVYSDELPFHNSINGLRVALDRQVFDTGENSLDKLICPNCNMDIVSYPWDFDPWCIGDTNNMTCAKCGCETEIHNFTFEPDWGFSDLGFEFWNWSEFKDEFINEFIEKLGCEVSIVYKHI